MKKIFLGALFLIFLISGCGTEIQESDSEIEEGIETLDYERVLDGSLIISDSAQLYELMKELTEEEKQDLSSKKFQEAKEAYESVDSLYVNLVEEDIMAEVEFSFTDRLSIIFNYYDTLEYFENDNQVSDSLRAMVFSEAMLEKLTNFENRDHVSVYLNALETISLSENFLEKYKGLNKLSGLSSEGIRVRNEIYAVSTDIENVYFDTYRSLDFNDVTNVIYAADFELAIDWLKFSEEEFAKGDYVKVSEYVENSKESISKFIDETSS